MTLEFLNGHLFVPLPEGRFLLDTGAPQSFGDSGQVTVATTAFPIPADFMGLDASTLAQHVGVPVCGLLGADILNRFDIQLDVDRAEIVITEDELDGTGDVVSLRFVLGVPILPASVGGAACDLFFDTGAQISFWQDERLAAFPSAGDISDFYPGFGSFTAPSHECPVTVGTHTAALRIGRLPDLLGLSLMMAGSSGILGNEFLKGRIVQYLPRRSQLRVR